MKDICNIKNLLFSFFVSPEFIFFIVAFFLKGFFRIEFIEPAAKYLFFDNSIATSITLLVPVALLGFSVKVQGSLLRPHERNTALVKFPLYKQFKQTTFVGLFFSILPILPTFISIILKDYYVLYDIGYYYFVLICISGISLVSMYLSKFTLNEILDEFISGNS